MKFKIRTADTGGPKKYPCPDCSFCQFCPDSRCDVCLKEQRGKSTNKKGGGKTAACASPARAKRAGKS